MNGACINRCAASSECGHRMSVPLALVLASPPVALAMGFRKLAGTLSALLATWWTTRKFLLQSTTPLGEQPGAAKQVVTEQEQAWPAWGTPQHTHNVHEASHHKRHHVQRHHQRSHRKQHHGHHQHHHNHLRMHHHRHTRHSRGPRISDEQPAYRSASLTLDETTLSAEPSGEADGSTAAVEAQPYTVAFVGATANFFKLGHSAIRQASDEPRTSQHTLTALLLFLATPLPELPLEATEAAARSASHRPIAPPSHLPSTLPPTVHPPSLRSPSTSLVSRFDSVSRQRSRTAPRS